MLGTQTAPSGQSSVSGQAGQGAGAMTGVAGQQSGGAVAGAGSLPGTSTDFASLAGLGYALVGAGTALIIRRRRQR
ncbi:MAG TPA: LPXTG cell wall anchor domain-containing protein [Candidatus Limnocylindria bacterium]